MRGTLRWPGRDHRLATDVTLGKGRGPGAGTWAGRGPKKRLSDLPPAKRSRRTSFAYGAHDWGANMLPTDFPRLRLSTRMLVGLPPNSLHFFLAMPGCKAGSAASARGGVAIPSRCIHWRYATATPASPRRLCIFLTTHLGSGLVDSGQLALRRGRISRLQSDKRSEPVPRRESRRSTLCCVDLDRERCGRS